MKLPKLLGVLMTLLTLPLAAQVSFTGSYSENFNAMGTGTTAPSGWSFIGAIGGDKDSWLTSIPASGTPSAATAGTANATLGVNSNAGAGVSASNTTGYNLALSSSTSDRCVGCSATGGAGLIWQLRLTNNTSGPLTAVRIGYDLRRFTTVSTVEQIPGYRLFVSTNGGTSWTSVSALDPVRSGGTINVPSDSLGVTNVALTSITLPSSVAVGAEVRFRWVDDNGAPSPDQIIGLDNVVVEIPQDLPTVALTEPVANASFARPATVTVSADANDTDGTVTLVEFFANGTKIGEDDTAPYTTNWSGMISGTYALTAKATDNAGGTATSAAVSITITNPGNTAPTVAITSPVNNATILTSSTTLVASVSDNDGVVSKVEFFNGSTKLGEDTTSPFSFDWTGVATGTYTLTAVATDNDGATTTSAPVNVSVAVPIQSTLVSKGSVWKYLDNGSDQGSAWKETSFNDTAWASGPAVLGGGDSHVVTTVNLGSSGARYITTYFRRTFTVNGAAAVQDLNMNIMRDDGVVVYINGIEVARQNMPAGVINYLTNSSEIISGADETTYFTSSASPMPVLIDGENTIAVEVHQRDANSSDLGFDLELIALSLPGTPPTVAITAPTEGANYTAPATISFTADATDSDGTISKVEFFKDSIKLGEITSAPFTFDWTMVPQGDYALTARATDNYGQSTMSAAVNVSVGAPNTLAPVASLTSPASGATYLDPATMVIAAAASDSDGTVVKVEFFNGDTKLGESTTAPYTYTWSGVAAGTYNLTARATDNMTATGTSSAVTVTVDANLPPVINLATPADLASVPAPVINLRATVSDPNEGTAGHEPLTVTFYGREKGNMPGPDFSLVTIPDTQFYSENSGGTRLAHFTSQTNWIVNSRTSLNTAFVAHMGDMVNTASVAQEWTNAKLAMGTIEDPTLTSLLQGMPWGGAPGNHDGTGTEWDTHFGPGRFAGRDYYQGNYNNSNRNNYQFFSASGMDFIIINLAYNSNTAGNQAVMDWADALLKAHPNRRAIVTSHWLIGTSFPPAQSSWGGHGQALYDNLKDNPNLFMMLCGHIHGEGRRVDTFEGRTVYTVLQDYQSRSNGGDSWLRYYTFKPTENKIYAYTYRTNTGAFETDADSQFTLDYNMSASAPWTELGSVTATSGSASVTWTGLESDKEYEWYAAVSDGITPVGSSVRSFTTDGTDTTAPVVTPPANLIAEAATPAGAQVTYPAATATDDVAVTSMTYSHESGSTFPMGVTTVTVTAKDAADNTGTATFTVTVVDTTAPVVTAPSNVTAEATGPTGATVAYEAATASDIVAVTSLSYSHQSGSTFPVGVTTVTITAKDAADNTSTATFAVTVTDTTAPVVTPPANVIATATSLAGATVNYPAATATDNVAVTSLTYSHASGSTFPVGVTTVTATAKDAADNSGTATFTVTVNPSASATLASLSIINATLSPAFGPATLSYAAEVPFTVTELNLTAAAAFPGATIQQTPANPVPLSVGPNLVGIQVTAQDGTTQALYQVTVTRAEPATISLSQPVYTVNQGSTSVTVTVTRTASTGTASAFLDAENGIASSMPPFEAAIEGTDYVDLTGVAREVNFAAGEMSKNIQISLTPQTTASTPNKRFTIALSNPDTGSVLGSYITASVEILAADSKKPTLKVTSPATRKISAPSPYLVEGIAGDAKGIDRVEIVLNGGAAVNAAMDNTTKPTSQPYSLSIQPIAGENTLVVTAFDLLGNATTITRKFDFVRRYVLSVSRAVPEGTTLDAAGDIALATTPGSGASSLTPASANSNPETSAVLPGTSVKLTAKPEKGYVFSHWSGIPSGSSALGEVLTFTMPEEDVPAVTAHFIVNPFDGPAGASNLFYGLIHPDGETPSSSSTEGFITGTLTPAKGTFSGKIFIDGVSQAFLAYFNGDGTSQFKVKNTKQDTLAFEGKELTLNFASGTIIAEVASSNSLSSGTATRALYSASNKVPSAMFTPPTSASRPAPKKGYFTVGFPTKAQSPARSADSFPQGDGFGTLTVSDIGVLTLSGTLADGTIITGSSGLVVGNTCPVFIQITTPGAAAAVKGGLFTGTLTFDATATDSDVSGEDLLWFRPTVTAVSRPAAKAAATRLYTAGWPDGIHVDAVGALYDKTVKVETGLGLPAPNATSGNARLTLTDGKLNPGITKTNFNIDGNAVRKIPDPVKPDTTFTLKLTPATGAFSGSFTPNWTTPDKKKPDFKGIMIQKGANKGGFGFFLSNSKDDTSSQGGGVSLGAP